MLFQPPEVALDWTPSVAFATPEDSSWVITTATARAAKQRGLVFTRVTLNITPTIGTGSGNLIVSGMPYPLQAPYIDLAVGPVRNLNLRWVWPVGATQVVAIPLSATTFGIAGRGAALGLTMFTAANMTTGQSHTVVFTYTGRGVA
jgi:hypothetical protein